MEQCSDGSVLCVCHPGTQEIEQEEQEFRASLSYMGPCLEGKRPLLPGESLRVGSSD